MEDQNKKIDSLSKQVEDQNNEVKDLKIKLVGSENRTLKRLQQQIDALVESNDQKEKAIKQTSVEEQEQGNTVDEHELTSTLVRDERCEGGERLDPLNYSTHRECIDLVKEMKSVITKSENEKRKFDKDDFIKNIGEFRERLDQLDPCTM